MSPRRFSPLVILFCAMAMLIVTGCGSSPSGPVEMADRPRQQPLPQQHPAWAPPPPKPVVTPPQQQVSNVQRQADGNTVDVEAKTKS